VALADSDGTCLARIGDISDFPFEEAIPLLSGSVAGLCEAGRVIDGKQDSVNLAYRESEKENLYVVNVGVQLLLIIVIDRSPYSCRLGSVWYMAQETAQTLMKKIGEEEYASPKEIFGENLNQEVDGELDKLFAESETTDAEASPPQSAQRQKSSESKKLVEETAAPTLLSYQDAVKFGLIEK
jgi:hypothetical protein